MPAAVREIAASRGGGAARLRLLCPRNTSLPLPAAAAAAAAAKGVVAIQFVKADGTPVTVSAPVGDNLLEVAHANNIDIEGTRAACAPRCRVAVARAACEPPSNPNTSAGACGGEAACSTCHVILEKKVFDRLPRATAEEEDMLDLATGLTKTSRLGCQARVPGGVTVGGCIPRRHTPPARPPQPRAQVVVTTDLAGMVVTLPKEVSNMQNK